MAKRTYISIITVNVNGLNAPIKTHRVAEWIEKQTQYICCLQETHFRSKDTYREFLGGPVVRTQHFHCHGPRFNPWLGN